MNAQYLHQFRKHYFFWLDDINAQSAARALTDAFTDPDLFQLSMARGMYSSLQVLDAIKNNDLPHFDIALLDVCLKNADRYFIKWDSTAYTTPLNPTPIYVHDKAELNKVVEFAGPKKFDFNFQKVKAQAKESGGLLIWAWASHICYNAKFIIYSANEQIKSRIEFLQIAGVLEVCNKLDLFHVKSFEDQIEALDARFADYVTLVDQAFPGINKITYVPFSSTAEGELLSENAEVEKAIRDHIEPEYFAGVQWREKPGIAFVIHELETSNDGDGLLVTYERFLDFEKRIKNSRPIPYIVEKVIEVIHAKIDRSEIDTVLARAILTSETDQMWTIKIADEPSFSLPAHLLPLGGVVDPNNRTIAFERLEKAQETYTFPSFFLPWGSALLSDDKVVVQKALADICAEFGGKLKNGCTLMRRFCLPYPFHAFIEQEALSKTDVDAQLAITEFDALRIKSLLLVETANAIEVYLKGGSPYSQWRNIKDKLELTFEALHAQIEKVLPTMLDGRVQIEITPRGELETISEYADMDWVWKVLMTVFSNLNAQKAFNKADGFAGTPIVKVSLKKETAPTRINIIVQDNGVGLDVNRLCAPNTGYHSLLQGQCGKLLQSYGRLTVRSTNGEYDLETQKVVSSEKTKCGTLVTFSIILA